MLSTAASQLAPSNLAAAIITSTTVGPVSASGIAGALGSIETQALTMKLKIFLPLIAATSVTVPLVMQLQDLDQLREETASLRREVHALPEVRREFEQRRAAKLALDELDRLRAETRELASLRAEVATLNGLGLTAKRRL